MSHWKNFYYNWTMSWSFLSPLEIFIISLILMWSLVWKGLALWKAARQEKKWWFIGLLLINTLGILEILYIYVLSKDKDSAPHDS